MHCIVAPGGLPAPLLDYTESSWTTWREGGAGSFVTLPLYLVKNGKNADCWHVGGSNHGCFLHFDPGGTPRLGRPRSLRVQSGGLLWLDGNGIFGGQIGPPLVEARISKEDGGTALGCESRYVETDTALAYSSDTM